METESIEIKKVEDMDIDCGADQTVKNGTDRSKQTGGESQVVEDSKINQKVDQNQMRGNSLDTAVCNTGEQTAMKEEKSPAKNSKTQCVDGDMMEQDSESEQHRTDTADHKADCSVQEVKMVDGNVGMAVPAQIVDDKVGTVDGQAVETDKQAGVVADQVGPVGSQPETVEQNKGKSLECQGESKPAITSESNLC